MRLVVTCQQILAGQPCKREEVEIELSAADEARIMTAWMKVRDNLPKERIEIGLALTLPVET